MYTSGEIPGRGTYQCTNCGEKVTLGDQSDTLPPCPSFNKVFIAFTLWKIYSKK